MMKQSTGTASKFTRCTVNKKEITRCRVPRERQWDTKRHRKLLGIFSFLYLKKLKFQKYISVLKNFKTTSGRPMEATGSKCNFFIQICNEVHGRKKWKGGLSPPRGTGACRPPQGRQGPSPLYKPWPPFLCNLSLKIQEKREGWGEEKRRSSAEFHTCDLHVTSVWIRWYCITI